MAELSEDTVADVMSTLHLIPRWRLGPDHWDVILASLDRLREAMGRAENAGVHSALDEIERLGPTRLASIARPRVSSAEEGTDRLAPPEPVMEILNKLIHPADGWARPGRGEAPDQG